MIEGTLRALVVVAIPLGLAACVGDYHATPGVYAPTASAALGQQRLTVQAPTSYRLGVNDSIQVRVAGEPDLSFEKIVISQDGSFNLAYLGGVHASGLTVAELTDKIREGLKKYIISPEVAVNLVEYGSQRITVEGSVNHPGIFELPPGTTLLGALATAGDPDKLARAKEIEIIRTDEKGQMMALVDLHAVRAGKMIDPVLQANDRVIVGVSASARGYQDMLAVLPSAVLIFTRF
jgi:polysaccharide export outer membrane protein